MTKESNVKFFVQFLILFFSGVTYASVDNKAFESYLTTQMKKNGISADDLGLYMTVGEGAELKVISDLNGKKLFIPASITKVATASAVLDVFPPGYKFKTRLYVTGKETDGVLKGNLYLKGGGDPSFVSENMWYLVNVFTRTGIKKIEGDLIVDDSLFDKVRYDETRQKNRVDRAYDAPVGAMSFNWNSVNIFARPSGKNSVQVYVDPENEYITLKNNAKSVSGAGNKLIVERKADSKVVGDVLEVSGSLGEKSGEVTVFKNITQPDLWSGYNLKAFLAQRGITFTGKVRNSVLPSEGRLVAESESKSIESIVADMNKFSNNYVAEMLIKNIGTLNKQQNVSLDDGIVVLNNHLRKLGIEKEQCHLESPSGLSRNNKFTSFAMWRILQHLRNDSRVQPEFLTSLPIAGVDGTLKKRMKNSEAERVVRAKTGFLTGVVSLAGYAGLADGNVVTFSFIYNGKADEAKIRSFFDELLVFIVK